MNNLHGTQNKRIVTLRQRLLVAMDYIVFCYQNINEKYSKSNFIATSKHNRFEDFLKYKLVDDYLNQDTQKRKFEDKTVKTLSFFSEAIKVYQDNSIQEGENKNDIFVQVKPINTTKSWEEDDDEITDKKKILGTVATQNEAWLQIECKILDGKSSQNTAYIDDIFKFCERSYKYEYQPFAGLIAFVNAKTKMNGHHEKINTALSKRKDIVTVQTLQTFTIRTDFEYSYQSIHKHRLKHNMDLYHVFLDYSDILTS